MPSKKKKKKNNPRSLSREFQESAEACWANSLEESSEGRKRKYDNLCDFDGDTLKDGDSEEYLPGKQRRQKKRRGTNKKVAVLLVLFSLHSCYMHATCATLDRPKKYVMGPDVTVKSKRSQQRYKKSTHQLLSQRLHHPPAPTRMLRI